MRRTLRTVARAVRHEIPKIRGSRFIGDLAPLTHSRAAEAELARVRDDFPDAHHHCHAWRFGRDGSHWRASDDGEPARTAGQPILRRLDGAGLTNAVLVVTRYFGGTKLGTGGLARAYSEAARAVIAGAPIVDLRITCRVTVRFGYEVVAAVESVLARHKIVPLSSRYDETIEISLDVPEEQAVDFVRELTDRTGGCSAIEVADGL